MWWSFLCMKINVPTLGTIYSHVGNVLFPCWEQFNKQYFRSLNRTIDFVEITPSRQKKQELFLFCARLFEL